MNRLIFFSFIFLMAVISCNQQSQDKMNEVNQAREIDDITALIQKYAESINSADSVLGSELFSHDSAVSFIHPRGHEKGWPQINKSIYGFFGETFATRDLKVFNESVTVYENTAWVEFYWIFDATFKNGNIPMQSKGRETQILRKSGDKWHIIHVHYSGMPVTGEREGF